MRDHLNLTSFDPRQQGQPAFGVHRFVQAVVQRLRHQRVIGNAELAGKPVERGVIPHAQRQRSAPLSQRERGRG